MLNVLTFFNNKLLHFFAQNHLLLDDEWSLLFLADFMIASALVTFVTFTFFGKRASYGRYAALSMFSKIAIPARIGWTLQEAPSFILPIVAAVWHLKILSLPPVNLIVFLMFVGHYFQRLSNLAFFVNVSVLLVLCAETNLNFILCQNVGNHLLIKFWLVVFMGDKTRKYQFVFRSFIYPLLIRGGKPIPAHLFLLGFVFCTWNGLIQGVYHLRCATYGPDHLYTFGALIGFLLFVLGMFINIQSDQILRNLRKPNEVGYKIPYGAMFEFVSCANFFGEIIEWVGYALFAQTRVALAFALFTAANTIPRAVEHHRWYLEHFADYPKQRTAVIPFLY